MGQIKIPSKKGFKLYQITADERIEREKMHRAEQAAVQGVTRGDVRLPKDFVQYNRIIGNPLSKVNNKHQDMAQFQVLYHIATQLFHRVIYLKSRKLGITESAIRSILMNCFDRYIGHDVMIVAGNKLDIAKEILKRFDELLQDRLHPDGLRYAFKDVDGNRWTYNELVRRSSLESQHPIIELRNDTRAFAFAASRNGKSSSFRGPDDIIAILLSEAAHTGMSEDQPLMNGLFPNIAQRDDADFIMETTGNGKRGFFYNYFMESIRKLAELLGEDPLIALQDYEGLVGRAWTKKNMPLLQNLPWVPLLTRWEEGVSNGIISQKYIDIAKQDPNLDFEQEHCCRFTSTAAAAFEPLQASNFLSGEQSIDLSTI